jgi:hypothetical protein
MLGTGYWALDAGCWMLDFYNMVYESNKQKPRSQRLIKSMKDD